MSKWGKGAIKKPFQHITDPVGFAKRRWGELKSDMTPEMPGETPEERSLRNRQAMDAAKLDEEENRRIKGMMAGSGGRRLFRTQRSRSGALAGGSGATASAATGGSYGGRPPASRRSTGTMIP